MSDTLELIDLEAIAAEVKASCDVCLEKGVTTEAKWIASHGNPNCSYVLCDGHLAELKEFLAEHMREHTHFGRHCWLHCQICGQDFDPEGNVTWVPL